MGIYLIAASLLVSTAVLTACSGTAEGPAAGEELSGTGTVEFRATDAPPKDISHIWVTTDKIEVHKADADEDTWVTVVNQEQTFNLVAIQDAEVFLGEEEVAVGQYTQIRLDVTEVIVTIDGEDITARLPSGKLKVVRPWEVKPGEKTILTLDFEADKFVVVTGKTAQVKPVIKLDISHGERELKTRASQETVEAALKNRIWVLESYGEPGDLKTVLADTEITATFHAEGNIEGSAGCNTYGGSYQLQGDELSVPGPMSVTMKSCGEQIDQQELAYLRALEAAENFTIDDTGLTVVCGETVLVFRLK
jgi:heat shock protein HslJ